MVHLSKFLSILHKLRLKNSKKAQKARKGQKGPKGIKKEELKSKKFCTTILLLYFYIWFI